MAGVELLNILTNKNCNGRHGTKLKQEWMSENIVIVLVQVQP